MGHRSRISSSEGDGATLITLSNTPSECECTATDSGNTGSTYQTLAENEKVITEKRKATEDKLKTEMATQGRLQKAQREEPAVWDPLSRPLL